MVKHDDIYFYYFDDGHFFGLDLGLDLPAGKHTTTTVLLLAHVVVVVAISIIVDEDCIIICRTTTLPTTVDERISIDPYCTVADEA